MKPEALELDFSEQIIFNLRALYSRHGYTRFRMNKFEEYDLYSGNKEFLLSDHVLTFTDGSGKLMALKPDVTLSIVKSSRDDPEGLQKLYYHENVYRTDKNGSYKELMQVGLECIGAVDNAAMSQVLALAVESLGTIHPEAVLNVSHLGLLEQVMDGMALPGNRRKALLDFIGEKNLHELTALCRSCGVEETAINRLCRLVQLTGTPGQVLPAARKLLAGFVDTAALDQLEAVTAGMGDTLRLDFSGVGDPNYYNGILFKGFVPGLPDSVLSGGQYDNLMRKMGRQANAVGFAVYVGQLQYVEGSSRQAETPMLNVALPKGRLGEKVYAMFEKAGFECPAIREESRKLIFENPEKGVRYFWVKPSDVAIYVERGAADIGVAGKDILLEYEPEVYELLDLKLGKCRMAVAAKNDFQDDPRKQLRVATKFANIAADHYRRKGRDIDIIHLNGSIEIAPILGLSDVIVDIVETGKTLKENDLRVVETVVPISARLIANKAAYPYKNKEIDALVAKIAAGLEE